MGKWGNRKIGGDRSRKTEDRGRETGDGGL